MPLTDKKIWDKLCEAEHYLRNGNPYGLAKWAYDKALSDAIEGIDSLFLETADNSILDAKTVCEKLKHDVEKQFDADR